MENLGEPHENWATSHSVKWGLMLPNDFGALMKNVREENGGQEGNKKGKDNLLPYADIGYGQKRFSISS